MKTDKVTEKRAVSDSEKLYIIDTTAPFFLRHPKTMINWSKAPNYLLEKDGKLKKKTQKKVREGFSRYIDRISKIGYNAISIDELPYMVSFSFYPESLRKKLKRYRRYYERLFHIARKEKLEIFVTTDILFSNQWIENYAPSFEDKCNFFARAVERLFTHYNVSGIIIRIGESDGVDVQGDFQSNILLSDTKKINSFIKMVLPVFEKFGKTMIFRTWTVGAYESGDLIWNEKTFSKSFSGIQSPNLIISLKFGETDFFRFQSLHRYFYQLPYRMIVELQTRREYEGFGEYPCFTGFDYAKYRDELQDCRNLAGIHVWCQTGGWSKFRNFTFLKRTSSWNELNTYTTLKLFKNEWSIKKAVRKFYEVDDATDHLKFLQDCDDCIKKILYDPYFAVQDLYMNRSRVPPLLHATWNHFNITDGIGMIYRSFVKDGKASIAAAQSAFDRMPGMKSLGRKLNLNYNESFYFDTFRILFLARKAFYTANRKALIEQLQEEIKTFEKRYPGTFEFKLDLSDRISKMNGSLLIRFIIRKGRKYRIIDSILFNNTMAAFYMWIFYRFRNRFPEFLDNQAMPVRHFLT